MSLVYLHTNKITQQKYVGITNYDDAEKRWREGKGYETQYFGKAGIAVYGWDGFEHQVLINNISPQVAATLECLLIKELESTNPRYGYNTSEGKIFPEAYSEAQETLKTIIEENPFILKRTGITDAQIERQREIILDPPQIKTIKAGTTISSFTLGAIRDYFDYILDCCLVNEKSNTSFLVCNDTMFAFIDKGEIIIYPFEDSYIGGQLDRFDDKTNAWRYKTIEITDDYKIKPTIVITGTIANMKEFPSSLRNYYERYVEEKEKARLAEEKRKRDAEVARLQQIAERQRLATLEAEQAEKERIRAEKKARRKEWFRKLFDFSR